MRYFAAIVFLFSCGLWTLSCTPQQPVEEKQEEKSDFVLYSFERASPSCASDSARCARFSATFPLLKRGELAEAVVQRINDQTREQVVLMTGLSDQTAPVPDLETQSAAFLADFQDYLTFSGENQLPWTIETMGEVRHRDQNVLSIGLESYQFTGGAHPNGFTRFLNYDLLTGRLLEWKDILTDSLSFVDLAEAVFRKVREIPPQADIAEAGFFWGDSFRPPNNFSLEPQGLRLFYNTYEIAPYALGPTEFVLPYADLRGVLQPKYLKIE